MTRKQGKQRTERVYSSEAEFQRTFFPSSYKERVLDSRLRKIYLPSYGQAAAREFLEGVEKAIKKSKKLLEK